MCIKIAGSPCNKGTTPGLGSLRIVKRHAGALAGYASMGGRIGKDTEVPPLKLLLRDGRSQRNKGATPIFWGGKHTN